MIQCMVNVDWTDVCELVAIITLITAIEYQEKHSSPLDLTKFARLLTADYRLLFYHL